MADGKKDRVYRTFLLVAIVVFGVGVGLWLSLTLGPYSDEASGPSTGQQSGAKGSPTVSSPNSTESSERSNPYQPRSARQHSDQNDACGATSDAAEDPDDDSRTGHVREMFALKFENSSGDPVGGVAVDIRPLKQDARGREELGTARAFTTDAEGRIDLPSHEFLSAVLRVTSKGWRLEHRENLRDDGWLPCMVGRAIVLNQVLTYRIRAHYADGLAYEGDITLHFGKGGSWSFEMQRGEASIEMPVGMPLAVQAESHRPGFGSANVTWEPDAVPAGVLELTLQASEVERGFIEVDLFSMSADESFIVTVVPHLSGYDTRYSAETPGGNVHVTRGMRPGKYRVYVNDPVKRGAAPRSIRKWHSQVISLGAGDVVRVKADLKLAASVRARLIDENGEPLETARLFIELSSKAATNWRRWRRYRRESGEKGVAQINNAFAGRIVIGAEAEGYDIVLQEIELEPGQEYDLGTIQLAPATGAIEVEIANWDPDRKYVVQLYEWAGTAMSDEFTMDGPTFRFDRLSKRSQAIVVKAEGLKFHHENVHLSDENPTAQLQIEMHPSPKKDE